MVKREDVRVAVLRIEGTNNEQEMWDCFHELGARPELVHLNQLIRNDLPKDEKRSLDDYHVLMLPGGFSAGDYVRAGAIYAARMKAALAKDLEAFVEAGKPIGGMCNGFQILVELGLLPGVPGEPTHIPSVPAAVLNRNDSARFECRPTLLKHVNRGKCVFTQRIPHDEVRLIPSAHAEGKFMLPKEREQRELEKLIEEDRVVFTYVGLDGEKAPYPWTPSGSLGGIAGITNETGTVFGMMPHPERVFHRWQHPDWTRDAKHRPDEPGDGRAVFESVLDHVEKRF